MTSAPGAVAYDVASDDNPDYAASGGLSGDHDISLYVGAAKSGDDDENDDDDEFAGFG